MRTALTAALIGAVATIALGSAAWAETALRVAINAGAKTLTGPEIAERLAGKTVTFESNSTGERWLVYYDGNNGTRIRQVGGDRVFDGFYATSVADHVCLGNFGDKAVVLRCVNVVEIDGVLHKFELDGSLRGKIVESHDGNLT